MPSILFGVESYVSRSLPLSAQRMVNCFFEKQPRGAKSQTPIFGSPGLTPWTTLPEGPIRGLWNFNGTLYTVAAQSLYRINSAGGFKKLGSGIQGTGIVGMSDNGVQVMVVNGVGGYISDINDNYNQVQNPNFFSAATILFFDNYFVMDRKGTNQFFLSGLLDGNSYNGDDFASAEAQPGFLTAVAQNLQLLFLFCQNHIEMWYDAGTADFPFQRYAGGVIEKGCIAPYTIVNQDEALFFLGADKVFYRLQGNVPVRVSTHALETAIAKCPKLTDASCMTYTLEGHKMVHLTLPSMPQGLGYSGSWVFDISTSEWHERESWDSNRVNLGRWRGNRAIEIYNKILIGDAYDGTISFLDWENFTERGNVLQMLVHSAPVHEDKLPVFVNRLELDMQTGYGIKPDNPIPTRPSLAPAAMLRYSKDGGLTWSATQQWRSMGAVGEYLKRLRWINLGRAYQWVFELTITDPVPRVLIDTHSDAEAGMR